MAGREPPSLQEIWEALDRFTESDELSDRAARELAGLAHELYTLLEDGIRTLPGRAARAVVELYKNTGHPILYESEDAWIEQVAKAIAYTFQQAGYW